MFDLVSLHGTLTLHLGRTFYLRVPTLTEPVTSANSLTSQPSPRQGFEIRRLWRGLAAILIGGAITVFIFIFAPQIKQFQELGYFGVFLINLIASASIVVPIPGLGVTFVSSAVLFWPLVGLASGLGQALGETSGYLAGYGGGVVFEDSRLYTRMRYWMEKRGFLTLLVLAAIPNPIIDLAGMTAGALKYPFFKFMLALWIGKTIKSLVFAWAGAYSVTWLSQFI